jgi:hypothetical protein
MHFLLHLQTEKLINARYTCYPTADHDERILEINAEVEAIKRAREGVGGGGRGG